MKRRGGYADAASAEHLSPLHARQFLAATWPTAAAKSRISFLETLSVALPVLSREKVGGPDPDVIRHGLRRALNQHPHARPLDAAELRALA